MAETWLSGFGALRAYSPVRPAGRARIDDFMEISALTTDHPLVPLLPHVLFDRQSWRSIPVPIVCLGKHGMALMTGAA
jgi:hypothetical protein